MPGNLRIFLIDVMLISRLQPNSSIFGLTKYIRQIVQYLVVYRISVFGIRLAHEYIWSTDEHSTPLN